MKVLQEHTGKSYFTYDDMLEITDIGTWFQGNTEIISFKELSLCNVTNLTSGAFKGCTSLCTLDLTNIISCGNNLFESSPIKFVNFTNLLSKSPTLLITRPWTTVKNITIDFGCILSTYWMFQNAVISSNVNVILRNKVVIASSLGFAHVGGSINMFVPSNLVQEYINTSLYKADKILAIGGSEWASTMQSLGEEEGYELGPGESWSDEYIDYKIYGVDPPEG